MQTFWIILICILALIGLAIIGISIWYVLRRKNLPLVNLSSPLGNLSRPLGNLSRPLRNLSLPLGNLSRPLGNLSLPLNYKDDVKLISKYNNVELAVCGSNICHDCTASFNVSLPTIKRGKIAQWRIFNSKDRTKSGPVLYGDQIILTSLYQKGPDLDLAACGSTDDRCGANIVVGRPVGEPNANIWTIIGGTTGKNVMTNVEVQLRSEYGKKLLLSACGGYNTGTECGINVSLRDDNGGGPDVRLWTITKL